MVGFYVSDPRVEAHLVDWDHVHAGWSGDTRLRPDRMADMPAETRRLVHGKAHRASARGADPSDRGDA